MNKFFLFVLFFLISPAIANINNNNRMIIRIAQIEVYPKYLKEYLTFANDVSTQSVKNEDGVIAIYPMSIIKEPNQICILEIYKNEDSYKKHINSSHFKKYKKGTLHMIKKLDLIDVDQLNSSIFKDIFKKTLN